MLTDYFRLRFSKEMHVDSPGFSQEAKVIMENYSWPGNVRELANTIQKALIFNRGAPISSEEISQAIRTETSPNK